MLRSWIGLLVFSLALVLSGASRPAAAEEDLISGISRWKLWEGASTGQGWFHPRPCVTPTPCGEAVLMTMQSITGSDTFGPVQWTLSRDQGRTWSAPAPIPAFARRTAVDGVEEGVCDVVPEYHPQTNTVLALGHNVYYRADEFFVRQPPRWTVYAVCRADGSWSELKKLEWDHPHTGEIYTSNCAQRVTLPDGDILVPLSYGDFKKPRAVTTVRCSFDGETLRVKQVGAELHGKVRRGFLEPSLAEHGGRFFMTIRAEDDHGYVTASDDGLNWAPPQAWAFDDGEPLVTSTTQQRWLTHADALYLVYTRRDASNAKVFRWRAPLYVAQVDPRTLRLIRRTERIALPLEGDGVKAPKFVPHLGNFHTFAVSPHESWITVGEARPGENWGGDTLLARIAWKQPNRDAPTNLSPWTRPTCRCRWAVRSESPPKRRRFCLKIGDRASCRRPTAIRAVTPQKKSSPGVCRLQFGSKMGARSRYRF